MEPHHPLQGRDCNAYYAYGTTMMCVIVEKTLVLLSVLSPWSDHMEAVTRACHLRRSIALLNRSPKHPPGNQIFDRRLTGASPREISVI